MSQYSHEDKKKQLYMIQKIRNKNKLKQVYLIIKKYNPSITVTENDNGIFLKFNDLNDDTYRELGELIKKYIKNKLLSEQSETYKTIYTPYSQDDLLGSTKFAAKLKYSNKEKTLIKKKMYDRLNKETNNDS